MGMRSIGRSWTRISRFRAPLAGRLGSKRWMSELGRKGGRATSAAKSEAARINGQKGGRPRKSAKVVHTSTGKVATRDLETKPSTR